MPPDTYTRFVATKVHGSGVSGKFGEREKKNGCKNDVEANTNIIGAVDWDGMRKQKTRSEGASEATWQEQGSAAPGPEKTDDSMTARRYM
jgi:hypothetical protein